MNETVRTIGGDPLEAARRVSAEAARATSDDYGRAQREAEERDAAEKENAKRMEAELRAAVEADELRRDAIYADAMTSVARLRARVGRDPTIWMPHAARTALGIAALLLAEQDKAEIASDEDPAFKTAPDDEKRETAKRTRTAGAYRAIAAIAK